MSLARIELDCLSTAKGLGQLVDLCMTQRIGIGDRIPSKKSFFNIWYRLILETVHLTISSMIMYSIVKEY